MGVRDLIRQKKEEFLDRQSEKASQRLVELKLRSSKEESRAKVFREERKELDKISRARTETKDLLHKKRFGGINSFLDNADKNIQKAKKINKKLKKVIGKRDENNPWK